MGKISIEIKWAFIFIMAQLIWMVLEKVSGLHDVHIDKHLYLTNLFAIPAIAIYVFALRDKKRNYYHGHMSYMQGFKAGTIISLIVMVFAPLIQWITSVIITPEYFSNVINYSVATGYYQSREEAEAYFNLGNYIIQSMVGALVMGLVTSAIVAWFVRYRSKPVNAGNIIH